MSIPPEDGERRIPEPAPVDEQHHVQPFVEVNSRRGIVATLAIAGTLVVAVGGVLIGARSCGDGDGRPQGDPTPNPRAAITEDMTFAQVLASTQPAETERPRVLTNFGLASLIDGDFPSGDNSIERVTVGFSGCTANPKIKPGTITGVVFRNSSTGGGFSPRFLTQEHIDEAEKLREIQVENTEDSALLRPRLPDMSTERREQVVRGFAKISCPSGLIDATIIDRQLLVGPEAIKARESDIFRDINLAPILIAGGLAALALLIAGVAVQNRRNSNEH